MRVEAAREIGYFDPSFFVDLNAVTGSPAIRNAYPMSGNKLLVSMWSPEVPVASVSQPMSNDWFWSGPYYEYAIVDLIAKTSTKVQGLPRSKVEGQKTLIVDGQNYVQSFRDDRGTVLYRVSADGVVLRLVVKTQPLQQWAVARELRRRIKETFQTEDIETTGEYVKPA